MDSSLGPGLYLDIDEAVYHADPCERPSLSSSIAKILLDQSPLHAFHAHPRLGGRNAERETTRPQAIGVVAHKLLLGRGASVVPIDAPSYQSKAAKEARDAALGAGCCPILLDDLASARRMAEAAKDQLLAFPELRPLVDGKGDAEAVLVWREGDVFCRGLVDWLHPTQPIRADLKTTTASASAAAVATRLFGTGAEIQDRHYHRGCRAVDRPTRRSFFIMLEADEPHALSVVELDEQAKALGDEKVMTAVDIWRRCLSAGEWPGYVPRVAVAECPAWHVNAWNNRGLAHAALAEAEHARPDMLTEIAL